MLIIVLWFLADWLMEFHSKGIYTLTWEKLTLLTSAFGLKAIQKFPESSDSTSPSDLNEKVELVKNHLIPQIKGKKVQKIPKV
ncbi:MAG: hypothetical protein ACYC49_06345 [Ignavibacteriaceae bacterium]